MPFSLLTVLYILILHAHTQRNHLGTFTGYVSVCGKCRILSGLMVYQLYGNLEGNTVHLRRTSRCVRSVSVSLTFFVSSAWYLCLLV